MKEACLRVLIELKVQGLAQPQAEDFQVRMRVADGNAFGLHGLHRVKHHGCLPCALKEVGTG